MYVPDVDEDGYIDSAEIVVLGHLTYQDMLWIIFVQSNFLHGFVENFEW